VRVGGMGLAFRAALLLLVIASPAFSAPPAVISQAQPPAQSLVITAKAASTWTDGADGVVQLDGPVTIELDRTKLTADQAVVWLRETHDGQTGEQAVSVALLGNAVLQTPNATRSGDRLLVTGRVNGPIRISAESRLARDLHDTKTYADALVLREQTEGELGARPAVLERPATAPTTNPSASTKPSREKTPIHAHADHTEDVVSRDGKIALELTGNVVITRTEPSGQYLEMQADRAVVFTRLTRLRDIGNMKEIRGIEEAISSAYLEGDVRVTVIPAQDNKGEQRLQANRVYYEFLNDRAVLTDAVIHSFDPQINIPIIVRAETVRQLSIGEYTANKAELTTSGFAVPSYSIRTDKAYVRQEATGDPRYGTRTEFTAHDVTLRAFELPFFYLPVASGTMTERGSVLRGLEVGNNNNYGTSIRTRWGLLETFGVLPPPDLDASYVVDYYSLRGPALGLDADYSGGVVSETTKKAWNFKGDFRSYILTDDTGVDDLGGHRADVTPPDTFRGMVRWEHQQYFPDDWQLQLRTAWISDATFEEEWFQDQFNDGLPMETSLYLKRQKQTEAITFLASIQPNNFVTTADLEQEQFEVEKLPELGYHRIGDSLFDDHATFFSDNTISRNSFNVSGTSLGDQGYRFARNVKPGQPSLGLAGATGNAGPPIVPQTWTNRADLRQEIDFPFSVGEVHVLPYLSGRYIGYSDTPDYLIPNEAATNGGGAANRVMGTAGVRFNTQFWSIDNGAQSDLFDVHRVRHIIEPEVHLFTSATNLDPSDLFIYDENVDDIHGINAVQLALRQRWQTKRGGPGRQRTVDFLTLNVEVNMFSDQPPAAELNPAGFRGLFFASTPEFSIPRNSINADATWRMSDTTIMLADMQYNLDEQTLATGSIGLIAQRGERTTYYLGMRYIEDLSSAIGTIAANYQMTPKYSIGFRESFNFAEQVGVYSAISFQRRFDRFSCLLSVYNDTTDNQSGFNFGFYPEGLGAGASTDALTQNFNKSSH
jgi:lipopolysaccharide export system protein LptA